MPNPQENDQDLVKRLEALKQATAAVLAEADAILKKAAAAEAAADATAKAGRKPLGPEATG